MGYFHEEYINNNEKYAGNYDINFLQLVDSLIYEIRDRINEYENARKTSVTLDKNFRRSFRKTIKLMFKCNTDGLHNINDLNIIIEKSVLFSKSDNFNDGLIKNMFLEIENQLEKLSVYKIHSMLIAILVRLASLLDVNVPIFSDDNNINCTVDEQINLVKNCTAAILYRRTISFSGFQSTLKYHLFQYPLYVEKGFSNKDNGKDLKVLLLGFGNYGQAFLDACLEYAQNLKRKLIVDVYSATIHSDYDSYIKSRPLLKDYFSIKKPICKNPTTFKDSYGTIRFNKQIYNDQKYSESVSNNIISRLFSFGKKDLSEHSESIAAKNVTSTVKDDYQYIFISLGNSKLNYEVAKNLNEKYNSKITSINYVSNDKNLKHKKVLHQVNPYNNNPLPDDVMKNLKRMAFNVHITWSGGVSGNLEEKYTEFKDKYNYLSSLSNVLSIKYKLSNYNEIDESKIGFGIFEDHVFIADRVSELIKDDNEIKDDLQYREHRRWVVEKICQGWNKLDVDECVSLRDNKDNVKKLHSCLVRSNLWNVNKKYNKVNLKDLKEADWEQSKKCNESKLDELDFMSVSLHNAYKKHINYLLKNKNILQILNDIHTVLISEYEINCFMQWQAYIYEIYDLSNKDKLNLKLYDFYKKSFLDLINNAENKDYLANSDNQLDEGRYIYIVQLIETFEKDFWYFIEYKKYIDYKKYDLELIVNIPFILTYDKDCCIQLRLNVTKKFDMDYKATEMFENVAPVKLVNPSEIIYTYSCDSGDLYDKYVLDSIIHIKQFYVEYKFRAKLIFVIFIYDKNNQKSKFINDLKQPEYDKIRDDINFFFNKSEFKKFMEEKKSRYHEVEYDIKNYEEPFLKCPEQFKYIKIQPSMTIDEMLYLKGSRKFTYNFPSYFLTAPILWNIYADNPELWKRLCWTITNKSSINTLFKTISEIAVLNTSSTYSLKILVPDYTYSGLVYIINKLVNYGVLEENNCRIKFVNQNSIEVKLDKIPNWVLKTQFLRLFRNPEYLLNYRNILFLPDELYHVSEEKKGQYYASLDQHILNRHDSHKKYEALCKKIKRAKNPSKEDIKKQKRWRDSYKKEVILIVHDNLFCQIKGSFHSVKIGKKSAFDILKKLEACGYVTNVSNCSFTFSTKDIKRALLKEGEIFELFTYSTLKNCLLFDDVVSSYEVNWNGEDYVANELDCVVTQGSQSAIIECKDWGEMFPLRVLLNQFESCCKNLKDNTNFFAVNGKSVLLIRTDSNIIIPEIEGYWQNDDIYVFCVAFDSRPEFLIDKAFKNNTLKHEDKTLKQWRSEFLSNSFKIIDNLLDSAGKQEFTKLDIEQQINKNFHGFSQEQIKRKLNLNFKDDKKDVFAQLEQYGFIKCTHKDKTYPSKSLYIKAKKSW